MRSPSTTSLFVIPLLEHWKHPPLSPPLATFEAIPLLVPLTTESPFYRNPLIGIRLTFVPRNDTTHYHRHAHHSAKTISSTTSSRLSGSHHLLSLSFGLDTTLSHCTAEQSYLTVSRTKYHDVTIFHSHQAINQISPFLFLFFNHSYPPAINYAYRISAIY